jgi:hypothetical protein
MNDIALVTTYFDYPEYHLPVFYKNAIQYFNAKDIHIIRYLENDKNLEGLYAKLYHYKIVQNIQYYKNKLLNNYKYILFADATDTNFYRDPSSIIEAFLSFDANIVFCGEKGFWPPINEKHLYENKPKLTDSFYLNSGLYIGYTDKIIEHMETIVANNRTPYDDQGHWTIEYLLCDDIKVDQENKLFFSSLYSKDKVISSEGKIRLTCDPYMVHDNGPFTEDTFKIAELL